MIELTKQVQQLQLQIWMLNDQCDHLQSENRDLRMAIDMMRNGNGRNRDVTMMPSAQSSDEVETNALEGVCSEADVVRKVSIEGSYLLNGASSSGNSLGMALTRQSSFGGEATKSAFPVYHSQDSLGSSSDTNWTHADDGLHVIASVATSVLKPNVSQGEDGVTTLYRTLSRSLQENYNPTSHTLLQKWPNQDNILKRQKTLP